MKNNNKLKRVNIELSAYCGYKCIGCPNTYMKRDKGSMSLELFENIVKEISDKIDIVYLANFGEPLLNHQAPKMLELLRDLPIKSVLSTTGAPLHSFKNLEFLTSLDELIISINGFDQETYAKHQKGGDLAKVLYGLEKLAPIMQSAETNYILQLVANRYNLEDIEKIDFFAKNYSFDSIIIKSFNVMDNKQETFDEFIPKNSIFSRYKERVLGENNQIKAPCKEWFVINWNGDVNPCCWNYEGDIIFGNVKKDGVFAVWNSNVARNFREKIARKEYIDICVNCGDSQVIKEYKVI